MNQTSRMADTEDVVEIEVMDAEYEYKLEPGFVSIIECFLIVHVDHVSLFNFSMYMQACSHCEVDFDSPEDFAEHLEKKHDCETLEKDLKFEDLVSVMPLFTAPPQTPFEKMNFIRRSVQSVNSYSLARTICGGTYVNFINICRCR